MSTSTISQIDTNHFKLHLNLFNYEKTTLEVHLSNYVEKLQRSHPTFVPAPYKVLQDQDLLEFLLQGVTSNAPAFDFFTIEVRLIQQITPARAFFTAVLQNATNYFPQATYITTSNQPVGVNSTVFKLDSDDGFLQTPTMLGLNPSNEITVEEFSISVLHENFSFSSATTNFQVFNPVEVKKGYLAFPLIPSPTHAIFPIQTPFATLPMYHLPPPRLVLNAAADTSVNWNHYQQEYTGEQAEHIRNIRDDLYARQRTTARHPSSFDQPNNQRNRSPSRNQERPSFGVLNPGQFQPNNSTDGATAFVTRTSATTTSSTSVPRMTVQIPHLEPGESFPPSASPNLEWDHFNIHIPNNVELPPPLAHSLLKNPQNDPYYPQLPLFANPMDVSIPRNTNPFRAQSPPIPPGSLANMNITDPTVTIPKPAVTMPNPTVTMPLVTAAASVLTNPTVVSSSIPTPPTPAPASVATTNVTPRPVGAVQRSPTDRMFASPLLSPRSPSSAMFRSPAPGPGQFQSPGPRPTLQQNQDTSAVHTTRSVTGNQKPRQLSSDFVSAMSAGKQKIISATKKKPLRSASADSKTT